MLAIKHKIDVGPEPLAANDQHEILPRLAVLASEPLRDATSEPDVGAQSAWLQDWIGAWASMSQSLFDASAASVTAARALTAGAATTTPSPPKPIDPEISLWSSTARTSRPRSWYRPPQPDLLDPTAWGFPAPLAVYGVPVTPQMALSFNPMMSPFAAFLQPSAITSWSGFGARSSAGFGLPFQQPSAYANPFARQLDNPFMAWMAGFAPQPVNPWTSFTDAMTGALAPTTYSTYRSDSGHAVAQIVEPAPKTSSAHEAATAIMNLFTWPTRPN